jgi:hypothetical protein
MGGSTSCSTRPETAPSGGVVGVRVPVKNRCELHVIGCESCVKLQRRRSSQQALVTRICDPRSLSRSCGLVWYTPDGGYETASAVNIALILLKSVKRQRHLSSPPCHPYSLCLSSSRPSGLSSPSRPAPDSSIPWSSLALLCPSPANHRIMYSGATMPRSDAPRGAANHALPLPAPAGTRPSAPCPLSRRRPSR